MAMPITQKKKEKKKKKIACKVPILLKKIAT